ncbi:MAG: LuxR family transcriptional regulator [Hydrogenophaga sp.]|uniref:LuxR family transcriptional regulator n=1 Tax=Hydrogenophaga crocea TaxID=2716225 RepID=A0A6G8IHI6_9BURK|nr:MULTISPECIES: LuxR family transcriptional regulator [Hydrogenophaga]MBL0944488.1 LuxR family transcriptional regulator [Hydrogenophaga sp.]QIM52613.1 LuxR family transcriptional regulator [Hydrogenophaga crocea]
MQLIPLPLAPSRPAPRAALDTLTGFIGTVGADDFGQRALAQLNQLLLVSSWSVFRLHDDRPPSMPASGTYGLPDHTGDSWKTYRESLYQRDQTFVAARDQARHTPEMLVHWNAREIPRPHRERIYTRAGLRERLSLIGRDSEPGLLSVNLYRHEGQRPFSDDEIDAVGSATSLLLACVKRHIALSSVATQTRSALDALTRREREVCERLLKGLTYDGIAADMGVSAGTVKTYRNRAFERLGIHHRNQLFALVSRPGAV